MMEHFVLYFIPFSTLIVEESLFCRLGVVELFEVCLGGKTVLIHKGTVKTCIIVEPALLGSRTGGDAPLHEELGIEHALGENILIDRDVCVALEFMQEGIFADKKLSR